jgi:hypothetical protein
MVKVERSYPAPKSLAIEAEKKNGSYREPDVIDQLKRDFHDERLEELQKEMNICMLKLMFYKQFGQTYFLQEESYSEGVEIWTV